MAMFMSLELYQRTSSLVTAVLSAYHYMYKIGQCVNRYILCILYIGIAFPTCISINNCVCHFSPLRSDTPMILSDGNLVKMYVSLVI